MNKKTEDVIRNMDIGFMTHPEDYTADERLDAFCKAITDYRGSLDPNDYKINPDKLAVYKKVCAFFLKQKGYCGDSLDPEKLPPFDPCAHLSIRMNSLIIDDSNREDFLEILAQSPVFGLMPDTEAEPQPQEPFLVELNIPDVYVEKEK